MSLYPTSRARSEDETSGASGPSSSSARASEEEDQLPGPMIEYKNIFQTDRDAAPEAMKRWNAKNGQDGWAVDFYDDARAQGWIEANFGGSDVEWAWDFMQRGVLRADFLRYMLPLVKGGVYVDVDVSALV